MSRGLGDVYKRQILKNQNEKVSKIGSYYVWEADVMVKIVDQITGKEA